MKTREIIILILFVLAVVYGGIQWKRAEGAIGDRQEAVQALDETEHKLAALMIDHEKCLRKEEKQLRLELVHSYLQSLTNAQMKMEKGVVLDKKERETLMKRISYIIKNKSILVLEKRGDTELLLFLSRVGSRLKAQK